MIWSVDTRPVEASGDDGQVAGGDDGPEGGATEGRRRPSRRRRRLVRIAVLTALVLLGAPAATGLYLAHQITGRITKLEGAFPPAAGRPDRVASGPAANAVNILLLGTDRRSSVPTTGSTAQAPAWVPGAQRTDTMMVLHVPADRRGASLVSIPRDSWVEVPGHGTAKANAAYSWGGPALAVATVEKLTGVHLDHVAVIDWQGYQAMIDELGGIEVDVPAAVHDRYRGRTWPAGRHHLDGEEALAYAGQRAGLPGGDLDRVKRQHAVLRALSGRVADAASSPAAVYRLLGSLSEHLAVDAGWSSREMATLALSMRHLRPGDVSYLTAPVRRSGVVGDQSVVVLDEAAGRELWEAVRRDEVPAWITANTAELTGAVVP